MSKRAQRNGFLENHKAVFKGWDELKIIEMVDCEAETCHFLPHRPVMRTDGITTTFRPIFDASAHETGKRPLNDLLHKGPNLIDQISNAINSYQIVISADIEKAFLQLGILSEIENAEIRLIRSAQSQSLPDEKSIHNLCVFRDENDDIRVKTWKF
ncbi:hypothetical protein HNY73_013565 [Argiope bruennichi]|uniref:Uncharacterized protein n=1 Tax=Argiope bruennichi TaxID=94029 RepID=A0A8T0F099_ARGBR|nr:hypothetical protein HNY73_013565 [Argiope bruennichi]